MYNRAVKCLKEVINRIDKIETLCANSGGVVSALKDELLAQPAIMMHITVIYQQFEKLKRHNQTDILNRVSKEIISQIGKSRNITAHDYDSLNYAIIEKTIRFDLPKLKHTLKIILQESEAQAPQEQLNIEIAEYVKNKDILYAESKAKKEATILNLYKELNDEGIQIGDNDLKIIKSIQKAHTHKAKSRTNRTNENGGMEM